MMSYNAVQLNKKREIEKEQCREYNLSHQDNMQIEHF